MWTQTCEGSMGHLAVTAALTQCKGSYQTNLILGHENLSGSTLRGKASKYAGKYAASREGLLRRLSKAGIPHHEERQVHGKRVLVLGTW